MTWLIFSLLALTFFVIYDLSSRYLATKSENPLVFAAIYNFFVALMAPLLFFFDKTTPSHLTVPVLIMTVVGLIVWGLFGRFEYFARSHTEASVMSITVKLAPVINFFLALIILHESWSINKLFGVSLIVIANILLYFGTNRRSVISDKGLYYSLLVTLFLALGWLFDAINVKAWGVATFSFLSFLAPSILSSVFPTITLRAIKKELSLTPWWQIFILGSFNLAGYGLLLKALSIGEASKVIPITSATTPFIVLFGIIILGERKNVARKIISSLIAMLAIYLMR
ncbi:MAG: DMT family transporter [bacterium]